MKSPYYGMFLEGTGYYFLRGVVWGALINFLGHEIVSRQVKFLFN